MKVGQFRLENKNFKYKGFTLGCNKKNEMQFMYIFLWTKKYWKQGGKTHLAHFVDAEIDQTSRIHENAISTNICMKISVCVPFTLYIVFEAPIIDITINLQLFYFEIISVPGSCKMGIYVS